MKCKVFANMYLDDRSRPPRGGRGLKSKGLHLYFKCDKEVAPLAGGVD